jgi:hypothetical protein
MISKRPYVNPRVLRGASRCLRAAVVKSIAGGVAEPLRAQLMKSADLAIDEVLDDYCGTTGPHRPKRSAWGTPSDVALELASVITVYGNTRVQEGTLRKDLSAIAGKIVQRSLELQARV